MARTYATVGPMMSYAYDRVVDARTPGQAIERGPLFTALLRRMIEFVAMSPSSRRAFVGTMTRLSMSTGSLLAEPDLDDSRPDLMARLLPPAEGPDDGAVLVVVLGAEGRGTRRRIERMLPLLGASPRSRLLLVSRSAHRAEYEGPGAERVIEASWERISRKLPKADPDHAELWRTIGEMGRTAGQPIVQLPLNPRRLLRDHDLAREMQAHLDVFHHACRVLLGVSPRFSTHPSLREARLQAGDSRGRAGLRFGELEGGVATHAVRGAEVLAPLPIGALEGETDRAAAQELLDRIARGPSWRTAPAPPLGAEAPGTELIGTAASADLEGARRLLWSLLNPVLLRELGFEPAPARLQPVVSARALAVRLVAINDPDGPLYRIGVGGRERWRSLTPRVTREACEELPRESYAVAPQKNQSTGEYVWEVHKALFSLTIAPRGSAGRPRPGGLGEAPEVSRTLAALDPEKAGAR
ncbi:hypothetical protein [Brachybacterium hainanense]|uniref:Uncharacterized protein n=1 Tax=Brachybacterium hainanense TaxID=1541174 RepID=A0ABV6REW6_9MICO